MLFEIRGIKIKLGFGFAAVVTLMLLFCETEIALISFASSVAHETGHIACLLFFGVKPEYISLGFFGMRMECRGESRLDYLRDALFLLSGAAVNVFLAFASAAFFFTGCMTVKYIFSVNAVIAAFNLLPVEALDGGKALYLFLCRTGEREKADRIIAITSYLTVAFLTCFGIYLYLCGVLSVSFAAVTGYLILQTVFSVKTQRKDKQG
ncbi:MAG: site-2 protease family protein [Clostridia bacterium]|nr:site-2 protease family protein [Clostridia bacterium]